MSGARYDKHKMIDILRGDCLRSDLLQGLWYVCVEGYIGIDFFLRRD